MKENAGNSLIWETEINEYWHWYFLVFRFFMGFCLPVQIHLCELGILRIAMSVNGCLASNSHLDGKGKYEL